MLHGGTRRLSQRIEEARGIVEPLAVLCERNERFVLSMIDAGKYLKRLVHSFTDKMYLDGLTTPHK